MAAGAQWLLMDNEAGPHIQVETLEKYCRDELSAKKCASLEEHLLICEGCRQRLVDTETFVAAMRGAAAQLRKAAGKPAAKPARRANAQH